MRYYVYDLIDPRDGATFYVGKGQRDRVHHHEIEARAGKNSSKCIRIREILAAGHSLRHSIISRFDDEAEAYAAEAFRVGEIGLANLTNVAPGGGKARTRRRQVWSVSGVRQAAKTILRGLHILTRDGKLSFRYGGKSHDFTDGFAKIVYSMGQDIGRSKLFEILGVSDVQP